MTGREEFARALREMLEFTCCDAADEDIATVLAAADAYRADGLRSFAAELDEMARAYRKHPQVTDRMGTYAKGTLQAAAELARRRAQGHDAVSNGAGTGNARGDDGPAPENRPESREDAIRYDERRRVLDAARGITVLMTRQGAGEVAAVQWSALLEALGLKP